MFIHIFLSFLLFQFFMVSAKIFTINNNLNQSVPTAGIFKSFDQFRNTHYNFSVTLYAINDSILISEQVLSIQNEFSLIHNHKFSFF